MSPAVAHYNDTFQSVCIVAACCASHYCLPAFHRAVVLKLNCLQKMLSRRSHLLLTLLIIFLSSPILSESPPTCDAATLECQNRLLVEAEKFTVAYRHCLSHQLKNSEIKIWNFLSSAIRMCLAREKLSEVINVTVIGSRKPNDLSKMVILPSPISSPCVVVIARRKSTGGEGSAEQELVRLMPHCELHVADLNPNAEVSNGKIYNKVITIGEIGDQSWFDFADKYGFKPNNPGMDPRAVTLKNFLEKHIKTPQIDYLWIDLIAPLMTLKGEKRVLIQESVLHGFTIFDGLNDVTVCQFTLSTEIIVRGSVEMNEDFRQMFNEIFLRALASPILPIHSDYSQKTGMLRTTYLNMASPYCVKKFLAPAFCGNEACLDQKFEKSEKIDNVWKQFRENLKKFKDEWKQFGENLEKFENYLDKIEDDFEDAIGK